MKAGAGKAIPWLIATALAALPFSNCTLLPKPEAEPQKAVIAKLPLDLPQAAPRDTTLLVLPPDTDPVYDTAQMAYTTKDYQIAYFREHEWAAPPAQMLLPLLVKTLENTNAFRAVLTPPYLGRYDYTLRMAILALKQDFTKEPAELVLSLRVQLSDGVTSKIIATRDLAVRESMRRNTPGAGVDAANDAAAKALQDIAQFVLDNTR